LPRGSWRYELIEGELRRMSPAGHTHGKIAARFTAKLLDFVDAHDLGEVYAAETGFLLAKDPDTVRAPDAGFVTAQRLASMQLAVDGFFPGAPDLAVEVISPSDSYGDVESKVRVWLEAGTRAVVVLDPRRASATVYRPDGGVEFLAEGSELALGELLPGWSVGLPDIFR
jgi:Uma2 family endonuclease